ncbi:NPSR1-like protein [Mya arenaria]|uniref:NPSR1-like protein n=1 Tax=Mya arenaria TaxID=6604 RepID=A0ABY7E0D6_MYAAR|nr:NPSR1-like protein [Mya arenaria]
MMDMAIAVTCFSMAVIIVGLNGLVIFTLSRQKGNNRLHFFIRHLAIADLLVGLIAVTGDAVNIGILHAEWLAGDVMCRLHRYACYVILIVSNNLLIGMSFDRFLAVKYPLRKITGEPLTTTNAKKNAEVMKPTSSVLASSRNVPKEINGNALL